MEVNGIPGIVAVVMKDGEIVFEKALGVANVENDVPMKPDHIFRMASISKVRTFPIFSYSKLITAAALCVLHERGGIDWEQPARTYFPDYPEKEKGDPTVCGLKVTLNDTCRFSSLLFIQEG